LPFCHNDLTTFAIVNMTDEYFLLKKYPELSI